MGDGMTQANTTLQLWVGQIGVPTVGVERPSIARASCPHAAAMFLSDKSSRKKCAAIISLFDTMRLKPANHTLATTSSSKNGKEGRKRKAVRLISATVITHSSAPMKKRKAFANSMS